MRPHSDTVNMVNAPFLARERDIAVAEVRHERDTDYHTLVRVTVATPDGDRSVAGTLFGNRDPRLVEIIGIKVEAALTGPMLFIVNADKPGFIGRLGSTLGQAGVNIGTFHLGRREDLGAASSRAGTAGGGAEAVLLLSVDEVIPDGVLTAIKAIEGVRQVKALNFK